jgi:tRNA A-37 threonylcarbamoyl transferase component Bud32
VSGDRPAGGLDQTQVDDADTPPPPLALLDTRPSGAAPVAPVSPSQEVTPSGSAARAMAVFIASIVLAVGFLAYFAIRFIVTSDAPQLHTTFRGATADGTFSAMAVFDGPVLSLVRIVVVAITFVVASIFVAARHRRDPIVLLLATTAIAAGLYSASIAVLTSTETLAIGRGLAAFVYMLLPAGALLVMALFPTGRAVPRWSLAALPVALAPFAVQAVYMFEYRRFSIPLAACQLLTGALFLAFLVQRYRRHATLRERIQIKWLSFAGVVFLALQLVVVILVMPLLQDPTHPAFPLFRLLFELLLGGSYLAGMAAMLSSAARYRLWDIDRVINRTVVYAVVTALLAGAFVLVYFALGALLRGVLGAPAWIGSAIGLAISLALFPIARRRISRWIDRRFYGIGIDYERIAAKAVKAAQVASPELTELADYDGLSLLGRGGMGAVYRAHHADFKMPIALKVMAPRLAGDPAARSRFQREAEILEALQHPNVVPFLASGHDHGLAFIAMHYIEGEDLATVLRARGRLSLEDAAPLIADIAAALDAAHALGVVHRDVKPGNVLLEGDGRQPVATRRAFLMDFGVARREGDQQRSTGDDSLVGSLPYMSPEQIQRIGEVDRRADVYSLGATAYELVTGTVPFRESSPLGLVLAHLRQPPVDPRVHAPELPEPAAAAILTALSKSAGDRFATAGLFAAALRCQKP